MALPLRKLFLAIIVALGLVGCGEALLVTAHTSIATGCAAAATYAAEHDAVTDGDLDGFQSRCTWQFDTIERWHDLETPDGGTSDAQ